MTITYPDGSVTTSRAGQVNGFLAWIEHNKEALSFAFLMLLFPAVAYSGAWLYSKVTRIDSDSTQDSNNKYIIRLLPKTKPAT